MARQLKGVIFDVDGTLVDSNDLHIEAWREAFAHHGIGLKRDEVHAQIGKGGDQLIPVFLTQDEVEKFGQQLDKLRVEIFARDYLPQARPFPGVRALFERLRGDGLKIALATSAPAAELETHVKNLGVEHLVTGMTSADDADRSKPCPDIFEAALALLDDVPREQALVVGDTPYDALAAARAGMPTIALTSGGFDEETLRKAGAIAVYVDVPDLLERYDEWVKGAVTA
ncbi:MAG TPA: HAD family hydrolase [Burkholderiales bacterium]|nr:HAD family hydrolase [Burkholderiales bacterium]